MSIEITGIEVKGIEVPLSVTWEFPQPDKITLFIEIDETGKKVSVTCDWDVEDVDFLNAKQLCMMYRIEILYAISEVFDPSESVAENDDFEDFYNDKF
jgi:hypothetical protein